MKKLLSLILVAVMLLTTMPIAFAEGNTYKVGDIIQFGSYPQSKVTDSATITALNRKAPAWDSWTSYEYYSGSGSMGTMTNGDWMRYTDITYNGNQYRGVKFTQYRPTWTYQTTSYSESEQYWNGYYTNTVYWFKFEPIEWRVLDPATGFVVCETIIDAQPYSNTFYDNVNAYYWQYEYFNNASFNDYASDYETSSIRKWLNNDFFNTAFTNNEKKEINTTTLNNDGYYTSVGTIGYEALDSNSTNDKIFLLSYNEVRNSVFSFNSNEARQTQGSSYALCQGLWVNTYSPYIGNSPWLLRSPGSTSGDCCGVDYDGNFYSDYLSSMAYLGVRPALRFNQDSEIFNPKHECSHNAVVTKQPTHLDFGEMTYTCECGDTYTESTPKLTEHTYTSNVTTEPTHLKEGVRTYTCECTHSYTESISKLTEHTYIPTVTAPTCTTQGYTTYICECGDSYVADYVDAKGHSYTSEVTIPTTHLTEGVITFTCACGDIYTEAIAKLTEHTHTAVITTPTCIAQGYTTYTCECGDSYVADYVDMLGHDMSEYLVTTNPTCTSKGIEASYCSRCNHTETKDISMLQHTYGDYISDGKATCTTDGLLIAKCDNCDATDTKSEKGTHKFSDSFTIDLDPTCTTVGQKSRHCLNCTEKTDITPIGKLAHTYNTITIDPTCTDRGHKIYTCPCGDSYTEILLAKGHTFDGSVCTTCDYDKADSCTCNCHKTGLSALIWKMLNFFYRLLRLNPTCNCGIAHY